MKFEEAKVLMDQGAVMYRTHWNAKHLVFKRSGLLMSPTKVEETNGFPEVIKEVHKTKGLYIPENYCLVTEKGQVMPGWKPNSLDIFGDDWEVFTL